MAQMRSGMVVTFLIYPVRELTQMAHRVVILYDRADVVADTPGCLVADTPLLFPAAVLF
jgi:hypothetical protein